MSTEAIVGKGGENKWQHIWNVMCWEKRLEPVGVLTHDYKSNSSRPRKTPARKTRLQFAQNRFCGPARASTDADPPNGPVKKYIRRISRICFFTGRLCGFCSLRRCIPANLKSNIIQQLKTNWIIQIKHKTIIIRITNNYSNHHSKLKIMQLWRPRFNRTLIMHANMYDQDQGLTGRYHNTTLKVK